MSQSEVAEKIINSLYDGLLYVDFSGHVLFWNHAAEAITGFDAEEVVGTKFRKGAVKLVDENGTVTTPDDCPIAQTMKDGQVRKAQLFMIHKAGYHIPLSLKITPVRDAKGEIMGTIAIFNDNFSQVLEQEKMKALAKMALFDPLTATPNRQYLSMKFDHMIEAWQKKQRPFGIMYIDIDNFHGFTGNLGTRVLRTVAATIFHSRGEKNMMGRWEKDHFLVMVDMANSAILNNLASNLRSAIRNAHFKDGDYIVEFTATIAATISRIHDSKEAIFGRLIGMTKKIKEEGGNRIAVD